MSPERAVSSWSRQGLAIRLGTLVATGVTWTVVSLQTVLFHPDYWDPVTFGDWFTIWAYTAAWLLTAAALLVLREVVPGREAANGDEGLRTGIVIVAFASAVTGIANALEDGFGFAGFGSVYVIGILSFGIGMLLLAAMAFGSGGTNRRLAWVPLVGGVAAFTMVAGGGVLALAAWPGLGLILVRARSGQARA